MNYNSSPVYIKIICCIQDLNSSSFRYKINGFVKI
jgi:hypothetical protein